MRSADLFPWTHMCYYITASTLSIWIWLHMSIQITVVLKSWRWSWSWCYHHGLDNHHGEGDNALDHNSNVKLWYWWLWRTKPITSHIHCRCPMRTIWWETSLMRDSVHLPLLVIPSYQIYSIVGRGIWYICYHRMLWQLCMILKTVLLVQSFALHNQ